MISIRYNDSMTGNLYKLVIVFIFLLSSPLHSEVLNFQQHNPPDLLNDFNTLRERIYNNPRDVQALNSMAIIYAQYDRIHEAIKLWRHAIKIDPSFIYLYENLGSALKQIGKINDARLAFRTGLTYAHSFSIYYKLGLLEQDAGNIARAIDNYRYSLAANPEYQPAIDALYAMGYNVRPAPRPLPSQSITLGSYKSPVSETEDEENTKEQSQTTTQVASKPPVSTPAKKAEKSKQHLVQNTKRRSTKQSKHKKLTVEEAHKIISNFDVSPKEKFIALTFDDGPHQIYTPQLLDILKSEGLKATFFVVGNRANVYPHIINRIAQEGHELGNHTWNHISLVNISEEKALDNLHRTSNLLSSLSSKPCFLVRPPFGYTNERVKDMIRRQGWHQVMWDTDSRDWENKNPDSIFHRVITTTSPGNIILFHDIHPGAIQMLPDLIKVFKQNNYKFLTISEIIELSASS